MSLRFCKLQLADGSGDFFGVNPELVKAIVPQPSRRPGTPTSVLLFGDSELGRLEVVGSIEQVRACLMASSEEMDADWT